MQIEQEATAGGIVLRISGRLDTPGAGPFGDALMKVVNASTGTITLDLSRVDYVSSSGLRALLVAGKALRPAGRRLALAALQPQVREVFDIAGFSALFEIS